MSLLTCCSIVIKFCTWSISLKICFILHQKWSFWFWILLSKCDQTRSFPWIWSHLLKKSLTKSYIFLCSWSHNFFNMQNCCNCVFNHTLFRWCDHLRYLSCYMHVLSNTSLSWLMQRICNCLGKILFRCWMSHYSPLVT